MKKILLFVLMFLVCANCAPKKNISSSEVSEIKSIIENRNLNVVYRGIENQMTIFVPGADSIKVSGVGFRIQKVEENKYNITPGAGLTLEIDIIGYFKGKKLIEKREFRIIDFGFPHTSINGQIIEVKMTKENLAESKIEMLIPQLILELPQIKSFAFRINNEEFQDVEGNRFDLSAKEKIRDLQKGDSILIGDIGTGFNLQTIDLKKIIELKIHIK